MISLLLNAAPRDLSTGLAILNAISDPAKAMLQKIAEEKAEVQKALKEAQAAQANLASKEKEFAAAQADLRTRENKFTERERAVTEREERWSRTKAEINKKINEAAA